MAGTRLPLGLTRYAGNTFDKLHEAGCMCLSASSVPDLFGIGRNGRLALAAHAMGIMPINSADTDLTRRGKRLQAVAAIEYQDEVKQETRTIEAWVKDEHIDLYASPDVLSRKLTAPTPEAPHIPIGERWLPGEIKVVAKQVFDDDWEAGPPQKVLLQHQTQLKLTGVSYGPIIALSIGDFVFDLDHWDIEAHAETQELIMDEAADFLGLIQKGQLPPPDLSLEKDQEALIKLANVTEGMHVEMPDELLFHVKRYQKAGKIEKRCEKRKKEAKAHLINALGGAQLGTFSTGETVKLNKIDYAEQHRKAYSAVRMNIGKKKEAKATKKNARPAANPGDGVADALAWEETVGDSQLYSG